MPSCFVFPEPKNQAPQKHESKAPFPNHHDCHLKAAPQSKFSSHNDHRQQRNDRPPRFHRDTDFPKPGQEPGSNCPHPPAQAPHWNGQERWSRGASEKTQNDRREMRDEQMFPPFSATTFTRSKEPQQQMESDGPFYQQTRDGGGGNMAGPSHRRGPKDNAPPPKSSGNDLDGKSNNKRNENRLEEFNNSRRKVKADRPEYLDRQRDSGPPHFMSRGGSSGTSHQITSQDSRFLTGDPSLFQNGDMEHKRTGPIKPTNREQPSKKNAPHNPGSKRRSGQGKAQGYRGGERSHTVDQAWKPGDQCLALYWEDSKVCLLQGPQTISAVTDENKVYLVTTLDKWQTLVTTWRVTAQPVWQTLWTCQTAASLFLRARFTWLKTTAFSWVLLWLIQWLSQCWKGLLCPVLTDCHRFVKTVILKWLKCRLVCVYKVLPCQNRRCAPVRLHSRGCVQWLWKLWRSLAAQHQACFCWHPGEEKTFGSPLDLLRWRHV